MLEPCTSSIIKGYEKSDGGTEFLIRAAKAVSSKEPTNTQA